MEPRSRRYWLVALAAVAALIVWWLWPAAVESAPSFAVRLRADRTWVEPFGEVALDATIEPDVDAKVEWTSDDGRLVVNDRRATLIAPDGPRTVLVWATAEKHGVRRTAGLRIEVWRKPTYAAAVAPAPIVHVAPADLEVTATKKEICRGEDTYLSARATSGDSEVYYLWELESGPGVGVTRRMLGPAYEFVGPHEDAAPGTYTFRVRASTDAVSVSRFQKERVEPKAAAEKSVSIVVKDCKHEPPRFDVGIVRENPFLFDVKLDAYDAAAMAADGEKGTGNPRDYMDTALMRSIVKYEWDFGDGTPIVSTPVGRVRHTYDPERKDRAHYSWLIKLTMTREDGTLAKKTIWNKVQTFDPTYDACGFEVALRASTYHASEHAWDLEFAIHNAAPFAAHMKEVTVPHSNWKLNSDYRTIPAHTVLENAEIAPGAVTTAVVRVTDAELPETDAPYVMFEGRDDGDRPCNASIAITRFEGAVYHVPVGDPRPDFALQGGLPGTSSDAQAMFVRWDKLQMAGKSAILAKE